MTLTVRRFTSSSRFSSSQAKSVLLTAVDRLLGPLPEEGRPTDCGHSQTSPTTVLVETHNFRSSPSVVSASEPLLTCETYPTTRFAHLKGNRGCKMAPKPAFLREEKPKRSLNAYNFYFSAERQRLLDVLPKKETKG